MTKPLVERIGGRMDALTQETVDAWHRGECKMPGGKLVAVSVGPGRADGAIQARIDGDFFVEGDAEEAHGLLRELESAIGAYVHAATVLPLASQGAGGSGTCGRQGRGKLESDGTDASGTPEAGSGTMSVQSVESAETDGVDDPVGLGRSAETGGSVRSAERMALGRSVELGGSADSDGPVESLARRLEAVIAGHPTVTLIGASARTIATAAARALERERVAGCANACERGALAETRRAGTSMPAFGARASGSDRRTAGPERTVPAHCGEAARPDGDPGGTRPVRTAQTDRSGQSVGPVQSTQRIDPARSDARPVPDAGLTPDAPASPDAPVPAETPGGLTVLRDVPRSPAMQLALDQACAEAVAAGRMGPLIRLWQWDRAAVVIGRFQSLRNEVNLEQARAEQVTVVRRITGGGAMFAEPESVITYSLVAPLGWVAGLDVEESYRRCDRWVLDALRSLGIEACYRPINDIASPLGKIGGAAQRRFAPARTASGAGTGTGNAAGPGAVLHHTMLSYDMDAAKMVRILRISREKMSDKAVKSAVKRVDPLRSQTGLTRAQVLDRMVATLTDPQGPYRAQYAGPDRADATLGAAVLDRASDLVRTRFATPAWTAIIP